MGLVLVQIFFSLSRARKIIPALQVPVVNERENAIHWINSYLVNNWK